MTTERIAVAANYLAEPMLQFCLGRDPNPKTGIVVHGPFSLAQPQRHPRAARVGFIGTAETISAAREWLQSCARGVAGDEKNADFPGCTRDVGFFFDMIFDASWNAELTRNERDAVLGTRGEGTRFEAALTLLDDKLAWLATDALKPEYVVVCLPDDFLEKCAVANYKENGATVHRDLRRAIKARAMRYGIVTQLLRSKTVRGVGVDHKSKCAWNFFTTMYFKLGAIPWSPVGLDPETCFVGVSFFRPTGTTNRVRASLAQAFNGRGDAIVLQGEEFPWQPSRRDRSPHLDGERAHKLIELVLKRYVRETRGDRPRRVVIHKSTRFWPDELDGFKSALKEVREYDLIALGETDVRFLREGDYPALRGTHLSLGNLDYLYTTGFIPALRTFPHGHVPLPIQIADHHGGDRSVKELLQELLILTKMNWNSANFCSRWPVTLGSSRLVGEIMREIPSGKEPEVNFKYYV